MPRAEQMEQSLQTKCCGHCSSCTVETLLLGYKFVIRLRIGGQKVEGWEGRTTDDINTVYECALKLSTRDCRTWQLYFLEWLLWPQACERPL